MRARLAALALLLVGALVLVVRCGGVRFGVAKPNVLLVTIDTLRADHLGAYGFELDVSPHIDALAAQGVLFERAIAAASRTAPAHASIMTSRYTREHSIGFGNGSSRLENLPTLAEHFRRAGYATAAFIGNLMINRRTGLDRGFDLYDDELLAPELNRADYFERTAEPTTRRALAWLERVGDGPFFLWVHYQDPHGPYTPPEPYRERFRLPSPPGEVELRVLKEPGGYQGLPDYQVLDGLRRPSQYRARYAGEIAYADEWIGRLFRALDARARPSIVLLTADHGESLGEGERYFTHGSTTKPPEARVPFILRAPALAPGRRPDTVSHVDVLPTLLDLADLPVPADARGLALAPFLRSGRPLPDRLVFCDIGQVLSAYWDGYFMQVSGVGGAWTARDPAHSSPMAPSWMTHRWTLGSEWPVVETALDRLPPIRRYFEHTVAIAPAPRLEHVDLERLRALGYVGPE